MPYFDSNGLPRGSRAHIMEVILVQFEEAFLVNWALPLLKAQLVGCRRRREGGSTHRTTGNVPLADLTSDRHIFTNMAVLKDPANPPQTVRYFSLGQIKAWFNKTYV